MYQKSCASSRIYSSGDSSSAHSCGYCCSLVGSFSGSKSKEHVPSLIDTPYYILDLVKNAWCPGGLCCCVAASLRFRIPSVAHRLLA